MRRQGNPDVCARALACGMPAETLDSNDLFSLIEKAKKAAAKVRAGEGPHFLEVMTYRWCEHVGPATDYHLGYRTIEEAEPWCAADPVRRLGEILEVSERRRIEEEVDAEIGDAFAFAEASPFPDAAELMTDVFQESQHAAIP
jgi:TPP-dependent pyruvate/acetoin dehydrogenase alpha subunit